VRVNGTSDSTEKKAPASNPRKPTTAGTPRRSATVPRGSSARSPSASTTSPPASAGARGQSRSCSDHCTAATPSAVATAATRRPGRAGPGSAGRRSRRRVGTSAATAAATSGTNPRNTHRQPGPSASVPATTGPTSDGITQAAEIAPNAVGRNRSGYWSPMTTYVTTMSRPTPRPCSARPARNTAMSGASPAVSSPARNVPTPASSGSRPPIRSVISPATTMPTTEATSSAVNDQPYQASPSSSRTAVGSAVATAITSKAIRLMSPTIPTVAARYGRARMPSLTSRRYAC
jgi:hypothetical protein